MTKSELIERLATQQSHIPAKTVEDAVKEMLEHMASTLAQGLGSLLESRGLTRDNLMACGDGLNDCSMIRFAGVGVAMQNAEPPVKEAADYVTVADNNHDGVAEAIEKFIF